MDGSPLKGGADFGLFSVSAGCQYKSIPADIEGIGYVAEAVEGKHLMTKRGNAVALKAQGWQHF